MLVFDLILLLGHLRPLRTLSRVRQDRTCSFILIIDFTPWMNRVVVLFFLLISGLFLFKHRCQVFHILCERLQNLVCSITELYISYVSLFSIRGRLKDLGIFLRNICLFDDVGFALNYVLSFLLRAIEETLQSSIILRYFFLTKLLVLHSLLMHQFNMLDLLGQFINEI